MRHTPKPPQPLIQERLCDADILEAASATERSSEGDADTPNRPRSRRFIQIT